MSISLPSVHCFEVDPLCLPQATAEAEEESEKGAGSKSGANATSVTPPVVTRKETRSRKKTFRVPLTVAGPGFTQPAMPADQFKVCLLCSFAVTSLLPVWHACIRWGGHACIQWKVCAHYMLLSGWLPVYGSDLSMRDAGSNAYRLTVSAVVQSCDRLQHCYSNAGTAWILGAYIA